MEGLKVSQRSLSVFLGVVGTIMSSGNGKRCCGSLILGRLFWGNRIDRGERNGRCMD